MATGDNNQNGYYSSPSPPNSYSIVDDYVIDLSNGSGTVTIGSTASSYIYASMSAPSYASSISYSNGTAWSNGANLTVEGDADFDGDVRIKGRSLEKLLSTIEKRLAILSEPTPEKLEKFEALKKAYDHYKVLEALCHEDDNGS